MRRLRLAAALLWAWAPASAAVFAERAVAPLGGFAAAAPAALAPALRAPTLAPSLGAASLSAPIALSAAAPAHAAALAPTAAAPAAVAATANGLIDAPDVDAGLAALRAASFPLHDEVARIVAEIKRRRPELPISAENLFLIRDPAMLERLELPADAAGAARIVTDGRREVPVVILAAVKPTSLDDFVEFAVHEAVHLMDDGILRVRHDQELKHFFAEGWTQKRAVEKANDVLASLGRPLTPGHAYHQEIALIEAFVAKHGSAPLDELVRTGSDAGMRAALGSRWDLADKLAGAPTGRAKRLNALIGLVNADAVGAVEEDYLLDYVGISSPR